MSGLTVLLNCMGDSSSRLPLLPSWVPDWSAYPGFRPLDTTMVTCGHNDSPFHSDGGMGGAFKALFWSNRSFGTSQNGRLSVQGKFVGIIDVTLPSHLEEKFGSLFTLLNRIPQIYVVFKSIPQGDLVDAREDSPKAESSGAAENLEDKPSKNALDPSRKSDEVAPAIAGTQPEKNPSKTIENTCRPLRIVTMCHQTASKRYGVR
jgi:hypothetical protein